VLVTTPHLASVKDSKLLLKTMSDLGVPATKLTAVLNRVEPAIRMGLEVLEANLKFPLAFEIPHTPQALMDAVTDGMPLTLSKPGSDFSKAVAAMTAQLVDPAGGEKAAKQQKRSFLGLTR
jgi:Flp pilus assembly CpaE family ATPase